MPIWSLKDRKVTSLKSTSSILTVPLVTQNQAVGALQMINKRDGGGFTEEDAALATTFAGQAAVAIQNARLFEAQRRAEQDFSKRRGKFYCAMRINGFGRHALVPG